MGNGITKRCDRCCQQVAYTTDDGLALVVTYHYVIDGDGLLERHCVDCCSEPHGEPYYAEDVYL